MKFFVYNGTFNGLVESFYLALPCTDEVQFCTTAPQPNLFDEVVHTGSEDFRLRSMTYRLKSLFGITGFRFFWKAFLSEVPGIENAMFNTLRFAIRMEENILDDLRDPDVFLLHQAVTLVNREADRVAHTLSFRRREDFHLALIEPKLNILPLLAVEMSARKTRKQRLIFDRKRGYGMYVNPGPDCMRTVRQDELMEQTRKSRQNENFGPSAA